MGICNRARVRGARPSLLFDLNRFGLQNVELGKKLSFNEHSPLVCLHSGLLAPFNPLGLAGGKILRDVLDFFFLL